MGHEERFAFDDLERFTVEHGRCGPEPEFSEQQRDSGEVEITVRCVCGATMTVVTAAAELTDEIQEEQLAHMMRVTGARSVSDLEAIQREPGGHDRIAQLLYDDPQARAFNDALLERAMRKARER